MQYKNIEKQGVDHRKPLRQRAEETLRSKRSHRKNGTNVDLGRLVHELEIQQVELKLQNEELRHAQVELAVSRDRYTDLYESAPVAYVTLDKDGRVLESNQMACKMLGVAHRALIRTSMAKFVATRSQDDWYRHRQAALSSEQKEVCEIRILGANGTFPSVRAESIAVGHGKERCCRTTLIDITDRKRAEEDREQLIREQAARGAAEAAARAKDRFLAMISHELRTPLTPILGWVRMLIAKRVEDDNINCALKCIERNAEMQAKLVEDLLDVASALNGKMRLKLTTVELPEIVNAAVDTVRPSADAKRIHIWTQLDKDTRLTSGDPDRLQQVIWNLLTNAVKFTPDGGQIGVQLTRIASGVQITVSDTGEGIPENFLPHIFDAFSQVDDTRTRTHGGLGLGLTIVRHIVEMHGGTIGVTSLEGKGTTFTIRLPYRNGR